MKQYFGAISLFVTLVVGFAACGVNPGPGGKAEPAKEVMADGGVVCVLNSDCASGRCVAGKCVATTEFAPPEVVPEKQAEALPEQKPEAKAEVDASVCLKQENWPKCQCPSGWQLAFYTKTGGFIGTSDGSWLADQAGKAAKTCVEVGPKGEQLCPTTGSGQTKCNCQLKATSPGALEYRLGDQGSTYGNAAQVTNEVNKCQPPVKSEDRNKVYVYTCP